MTLNFPTEVTSIEHYPVDTAYAALDQFKRGCRIMGLTMGQYSLIDLIRATLDSTGRANVIVCSWSAGIKDVRNVKWMIESDLIDRFCIILDNGYKTRQRKYALAVEELFGVENIRTTKTHAKFVLIWNDQYKVAIRTSMNLNANRKCENFELDEGNEVFEFYYRFANDVIGEMPNGFIGDNAVVMRALSRIHNTKCEDISWC